jgi:AcrR family transcriptional regulator
MSMNSQDSFARRKIVDTAAAMVQESGSQELQIVDVAERADVDVANVEHFFESRTQLIAEAQMSNYFTMIEAHHLVLARIESAVADGDEGAFWAGIEENMVMAWSSGQVGGKWGIVNLLQDVWSDPFSQRHFCDLLDIQFDRWITVVEDAKRLGWMDKDIDAKALTAVIWSASVGQIITAGSSFLDLSPQEVRDFYLKIVRSKEKLEPSSN